MPQERVFTARLRVFGGEIRIDGDTGERINAAEQPSEHDERRLSEVRERKAGGREDPRADRVGDDQGDRAAIPQKLALAPPMLVG